MVTLERKKKEENERKVEKARLRREERKSNRRQNGRKNIDVETKRKLRKTIKK